MRRLFVIAGWLLAAAPAAAIQPGASGTVQLQNAAADVVKVDGGDSASGTTRAANRQQVALRRADDCGAQTDGVAGEACLDDFVGVSVCLPSSGACDTAAEWVSPALYWRATTQTISAASTQITVPTTRVRTLTTVTGTTTLTATPTIATSGVPTGTRLVLRNVDGTATDCVVLQDKSILASSALSLRASTRKLCPNEGGLELVFDGTDWFEPAPGTLRVREGSSDKGLLGQIDFSGTDFDVTATTGANAAAVALEVNVSRLGQMIDPTETEATGGGASPFALKNTSQTFTAAQTVQGGLLVEKTGGADIMDCGITDADRCETLDPTSAQDVATKAYVDRAPILLSASYFGAYGGATSNDGLRLARRFTSHYEAGGVNNLRQYPMPTGCTVSEIAAEARYNLDPDGAGGIAQGDPFVVPTGNTVNVVVRKNATTTNQGSCTIAAGNSKGVCTSVGAPTFQTPAASTTFDTYQFSASCSNSGSDCTDTTSITLAVSFLCK